MPTREGYAGTYATQENFRLMRGALDEVSAELGRYVRLTNYASGLCMPEIATLAGLERLDMMLNDSMYGILFRDINPIRTFVDQRFSRQVHARAGIIINTGEDNYLTTADGVEAAHTVTVSQLLNEYFGKEAGLDDWQLGLGHAFEINPTVPESFRTGTGARLAGSRTLPRRAVEVDAAHQTHDRRRVRRLLAERVLQPGRLNDRAGHPARRHADRGGTHPLALGPRPRAAERSLCRSTQRRGLAEDFVPAHDGFVVQRGRQVLAEAIELLERIVDDGLLNAIGDGTFGLMKRPADAGRGLDGVAKQAKDYFNPASDLLAEGFAGKGGAMSKKSRKAGQPSGSGGTIIRPYGDATGDGLVQVSFTLPVKADKRAEGAALQLANKMGLEPAMVVHSKAMGPDFTFFVVYGRCQSSGRPQQGHDRRAGVPAAVAEGSQCVGQEEPCAARWSSSGRASAPMRTPWGSTRS